MRVAWIMSAYNSEATIARAVQSIQAQSYTDWKLVVVDDGSSDRTGEILDAIAADESRLSVLRNRQNQGLATALNRAWKHIKADIYLRLDADDTSHSDRLRTQLEYLARHPDVAVLGTAARLVTSSHEFLGHLHRPETHEALVQRILRENPFVHPTVAIRREFLEAMYGYDSTLLRSQDYDLWLRGYKRWRYANLPEPLVDYCWRASPSWSSIYWGTRTLCRAVRREERTPRDYWYPLRFMTATTLMHFGLRRHAPSRRAA